MRLSWRVLLSNWLPAVAVMALIFWFSSQSHLPSAPDDNLDFLFKKLGHITVYSMLALSFLRGLHLAERRFLLAWALSALFAASDEFHQSLTPLRDPSVRDVLIDVSAAAIALSLAKWASDGNGGWVGVLLRKATLAVREKVGPRV